MAVTQTLAEPPNQGSMILPNMGWIRNSKSELKKTVPTWSRPRNTDQRVYRNAMPGAMGSDILVGEMKVILFGATGMIGQGVLRECLLDPDVTSVLSIGRNPSGQSHNKLRDLVHPDLFHYAAIEPQLTGFDAC